MAIEKSSFDREVNKIIRITLSIGFLGVLLFTSYKILQPFIIPILWGIIIAIALFPLHQVFSNLMGQRNNLAAVIIGILGILLIIVPFLMFTSSMVDNVKVIAKGLSDGTLAIPLPDTSVERWPIIGERLFDTWKLASENLTAALNKFAPQLEEYAPKLLSVASGLVGTLVVFIVSILIAVVLLMNTKTSEKVALSIFKTLAGASGENFVSVGRDTVRSVAQGVLGIAIIQSFFISIGLYLVDFPGAGIVSLIVLFIAIVQLPPMIVLLPAIIYVFSYAETTTAIIFTIWSALWSMADGLLKPVLLGRGVDVPMPVILLGAIGGMLLSGIIGLFVGAVVLSFSYKAFLVIFEMEPDEITEATQAAEETAQEGS